MTNDPMMNGQLFSQDSEVEIQKIHLAISILKENGALVMEDGEKISADKLHPIDRDQLAYNLKSFLKETGLRKRELEAITYAKWLRDKREEAIQGIVSSNEHSPAHLLYEFVLPVLRVELLDVEKEDDQPKKESLKKDVMDLVIDGKMNAALQLLLNFANQHAKDFQHDAIHLVSEFRHYETHERKGSLDHNTISTARAQIRDKALQLADAIIS